MNASVVHEVHRIGEVLAEAPAAVLVDHRHLVVAEAIDVVLGQVELGVVDQELPHVGVPVRENQPAHIPLVGEIKAAVIVAGGLAVEEVEAVVVKAAARVVVDDVEQDGDAVDVEDVDQGLELVDLGVERTRRQRRLAARHEELIDPW